MLKTNLFAKVTKFNESTGYFEGVAANETRDFDGEKFDYDRSVKHFKAWSASIEKATDGKSVGNVRAMHGKVSAGILEKLNCDDASKTITVCGTVVDANERNKFAKGCYTGLSIGGTAVDKWADPDDAGTQRYECKPVEISLVDLPCNPDATFSVVKSDGAEEVRKFQTTTDNPKALQAWWDGLEPEEQGILTKIAKAAGVATEPAAPAAPEQRGPSIEDIMQGESILPINAAATLKAMDLKDIEKLEANGFTSINVRLVDAGTIAALLADPTNMEKLRVAVKKALGKDPRAPAAPAAPAPEAPPAAPAADPADVAKAKELKRAAFERLAEKLMAKGDPAFRVAKAMSMFVKGSDQKLEKGLWTVKWLADLLEGLDCLTDNVEWEELIEQDGSPLSAELVQVVRQLGEILVRMVAEEVKELVGEGALVELASKGSLQKRAPLPTLEQVQKLQSVTGERDAALAKVITLETDAKAGQELMTKAAQRLEEQGAIILKLKDEPEQVRISLLSISKSRDSMLPSETEPEGEIIKNADGTTNKAAMELRKCLSKPVQVA